MNTTAMTSAITTSTTLYTENVTRNMVANNVSFENESSVLSTMTSSNNTTPMSNFTCINAMANPIAQEDCDFFITFSRWVVGINIAIFIFGLFNNSVLLHIIISNGRDMRTIPNIFIANMAILDIIFLLVVDGGTVVLLSQLAFQVKFMIDSVADMAIFIIQTFVSVALFTTLAVLGLDRYLAIVHPIRSRTFRTKTRAFIVCGFVWIISGLCVIPIVVGGGNLNVFSMLDNPAFKPTVIIFIVFAYVIPVLIIVCCYAAILKVIWWNSTSQQLGKDGQKRRMKQRLQVLKTVAIAVILFVLHYGYFFAVLLWVADGGFQYVSPRVSSALLYSAITAACLVAAINPVVYALHQPGFRPYVYKLLCSKRCKLDPPNENALHTSTEPSLARREMSVTKNPQNEAGLNRNSTEMKTVLEVSARIGEINVGFEP